MERAYLLIAGILTGAAVGMLTGRIGTWICAGLVMGVLLAVFARRRTSGVSDAADRYKEAQS